jgi:hypothetical protein
MFFPLAGQFLKGGFLGCIHIGLALSNKNACKGICRWLLTDERKAL